MNCEEWAWVQGEELGGPSEDLDLKCSIWMKEEMKEF